ncbi:MAG: hypothetical protein MR364_08505 [Oscillospiraceae bacterium]|nr:hypothetical protein [Oscillospiraceae bacterium]
MKKIILPIIIVAALGVGGGVTAVMLNRANTVSADVDELSPVLNVLKCGKYYLNGDKNADLWIEVNPDFLILKGIDVDKSIRDALVKRHEDNSDPVPEKTLQWEFEEDKKLYATEKLYSVMNFGTENTPYLIKVSRDNTESTPEELIRSNAGFPYNDKTNTIKLSLFGEFTLVD